MTDICCFGNQTFILLTVGFVMKLPGNHAKRWQLNLMNYKAGLTVYTELLKFNLDSRDFKNTHLIWSFEMLGGLSAPFFQHCFKINIRISHLWFEFQLWIECVCTEHRPAVHVKARYYRSENCSLVVLVSFVLWKQPRLSSTQWQAAWRVLSLHFTAPCLALTHCAIQSPDRIFTLLWAPHHCESELIWKAFRIF